MVRAVPFYLLALRFAERHGETPVHRHLRDHVCAQRRHSRGIRSCLGLGGVLVADEPDVDNKGRHRRGHAVGDKRVRR